MTENLVNSFMGFLSGLPKGLIVFIISLFPVLELRGGMIAAALLDMPLWEGVICSLAGNIVPIPFLLLLITPIFTWLKKTKLFRPLVEKLEKNALGKSDKIRKYQFWGLLFFVGVPLPGTGAWTGSLIAALLGIPPKKAVLPICLGVLLALVIMGVATYGIPALIALLA